MHILLTGSTGFIGHTLQAALQRAGHTVHGGVSPRQRTLQPGQVPVVDEEIEETPWMQIDNVFYEARGQAWALSHLLRAIEVDFADVLAKKNATVSVRQIIRELEASQEPVWSPMILNGSGFGVLAAR